MPENRVQGVFTDTGGTFTDTFLVADDGSFEVGKAATTPDDLSIGYLRSLEAAAGHWGRTLEDVCAGADQVGYGSTTAINTVLTRSGRPLGLIVTRGFEHLLLMQRGVQTYTEFDPVDRLHARTHRPVHPLVPQELVFGVTERVDCFGAVVVPLYRPDVERAAQALMEAGVTAVAVALLFSWQNPQHEMAVRQVLQEVAASRRAEVDIFLSHEVSPIGRELPRCNDTIIEAYTRPVVIATLERIAREVGRRGYRGELHVMQSTGGVTTVDNLKVVHTLESGPVGGVMGAIHVGEQYGLENLITTDVGGTSFDVGLVSRGLVEVEQEPVCARMVLGVPMVAVSSIGAGGGTVARLDALTGRLQVGPESAGAEPGPVCYGRGGVDPTVTDADLVLGYLNAERFLGGRVRLDADGAARAIQERIARPLGLAIEEAAAGINAIVDARMRDTIVGMVLARGFDVSDYHLLAFGGAGPSHVAAYTAGLRLRDVLVFPFASAFCAFGAASCDFARSYTRAVNLVAPRTTEGDLRRTLEAELARVWAALREQAMQEVPPDAQGPLRIEYRVRMRYGRQLDQILVRVGVPDPSGVRWDAVVQAFEETYASKYSASARFPQAGYEVVEASVLASAPRTKPRLPVLPAGGAEPPHSAQCGSRRAYLAGRWQQVGVYDWDRLQPGNGIEGPAIVETDTQTLVVPPGRSFRVDEHLAIHLSCDAD